MLFFPQSARLGVALTQLLIQDFLHLCWIDDTNLSYMQHLPSLVMVNHYLAIIDKIQFTNCLLRQVISYVAEDEDIKYIKCK